MIKHSKLTNQITNYLNYDSPERHLIKSTLLEISTKLPETAIFGGMLREFALGKAREFSSDIDLVSYASQYEIYSAIKQYNPKKNKFGGYRFAVEHRMYDIWSLDDTWAFREGIIKGTQFKDLLNTTFFNLDSAIFHLGKEECYVPDGYKEWIEKYLLEINMQENPSPANMARRAINMATNKQLNIGPKLSSFIFSQEADLSKDLITKLFIKGLKIHLDKTPEAKYVFQPQESIFSTLHKL